MTLCIPRTPYTGPLQAVVLDWAGTAVDYGCMGPAAVFVDVFETFDIAVSIADARQFMGLEKRQHIRSMCRLPAVAAQWEKKFAKTPDENDVDAIYAVTEPMMVASIARHADPIPGLLSFVDGMRQRRIKIGSCTGYTAPMMDKMVPAAAQKGYAPDAIVCSSDIPAGRPFPWMCYQNAIQLQTYPFESMIKIGDTISDIQEGCNAGMWTIGLTQSGNELGLPEDLVDALAPEDLNNRLDAIGTRFREAGAHYVVKGIWECLEVVDEIGRRLGQGDHPLLKFESSSPMRSGKR
ncbi:phosphonoacetaldehyde hydrolase [uncultured Desulfosarcina sp.]|uniref:phosphonoacetaldehyde hydrolase n=1 Tax=uncultured Desulfosarcina sp. TaxID=218289 RepID=UPI0029C63616|nr:phosphonoacetaldehyde hydrolase [uncultured Desulfosarcina sp.]